MIEVVSVRFSNKGKAYYFDPVGITITQGEHVVVETSRGIEYGECVGGNHPVEDATVIQPLRPVLRVATDSDKRSYEEGKSKEKDAFDYCQKRIVDYGLDMKLVDVEYGFEGNKILFFFTSDGRVDFRELVKDLAGVFKTRIELRQIGVRDEAKMLGGLGICGKQFCCSQFMGEFHPVSIKMAKTQGLSLNPAKISGTCGRLMCCLKYEECAYEDLVKKAPKVDSFVETPAGKGSVINVNLLRGNAKIRLEDGLDTTLKTFTFDELNVLGGKARRAEYIAAKAEGRLEEAGFTPAPPRRLEKEPLCEPVRPAEPRTPSRNQQKRPSPPQERTHRPEPKMKAIENKAPSQECTRPERTQDSVHPKGKPQSGRNKGAYGRNRSFGQKRGGGQGAPPKT